jgi:RNA polymerase sigma factor (sigma-70 family)
MAKTLFVETKILNTRKNVKVEGFYIDEGIYKTILQFPESDRPLLLAPYYYEYLKTLKYQRRVSSLDETDEAGNPRFVFFDPSDAPDNQFRKEEQNRLLHEAVGSLKPKFRFIVSELFERGKTQLQVAEELGRDPANFNKTVALILAKLRKQLEGKV